MEFPERPEKLAKKKHRTAVRTALGRTLGVHHRKYMLKHFQFGNRSRYRGVFRKRSDQWKKDKQQMIGVDIDLLFTGKTKRKFRIPARVTFRGGAPVGQAGETGRLTASMTFKFPFPVDRRPTGGVTIKQMAREVEAVNNEEQKVAAANFLRFYAEEIGKVKGRHRVKVKS
jgi:2',3'-cyclic-nucleotide 2'-phosphodiesterase (5'-nucleotidase family)